MEIVEISDELQRNIKNLIKAVEQEKPETNINELMTVLLENLQPKFKFAELDEDKLREQLWSALYNIAVGTQNVQLLSRVFHVVRILSREKKCLSNLVTDKWMLVFIGHIELSSTDDVATQNKVVEVEKALCNLIFNSQDTAKKASGDILDILLKRISNSRMLPVNDVLYFDVKLIFLITAVVSDTREILKDRKVVTNLLEILEFVLKQAIGDAKPDLPSILSDQQVDIACEALKALFNITTTLTDNDDDIQQCNEIVMVLKNYLLGSAASFEQTWKIKNDVINLLTNMPNSSYINLLIPISETKKIIPKNLQFENYNMICIYELLMFLKAKFNEETTVSRQHEMYSPVITVLLKGAIGHRAIRKFLRFHILPPLTDVHHRPEEGNTLRNHLCKLLTTPITQLRNIVAELLFILCKKSVARMIKYTGYGNAAGLFAQKGLLGGQRDVGEADYSSDSEGSETEEYAEHKHGINPVLGCYEEPRPSPMANMTEEQKEYEAMKLVQLIDDMTRVGTIKPCTIGEDGKPKPIEHVLELQKGLKQSQVKNSNGDSDSE